MSVQATFSATLVDEWARLGVTEAVICPGSRSTPSRWLWQVASGPTSGSMSAVPPSSPWDWRRPTGRPAIICVTSGTAAVELHPAVVEAHHARIPLIVCTADRPPELHDTGAPQTIDQDDLYGSAVRWSATPGVPSAASGGDVEAAGRPGLQRGDPGDDGPGPGSPQPCLPRAPDRDGWRPATAPGAEGRRRRGSGEHCNRGAAAGPWDHRGRRRDARAAPTPPGARARREARVARHGRPTVEVPGGRDDRRRRLHRPHASSPR